MKLTFEKAVIFTLILILAISSANIYSQYFKLRRPQSDIDISDVNPWEVSHSIISLLNADKLYSEKKYEDAIDEI